MSRSNSAHDVLAATATVDVVDVDAFEPSAVSSTKQGPQVDTSALSPSLQPRPTTIAPIPMDNGTDLRVSKSSAAHGQTPDQKRTSESHSSGEEEGTPAASRVEQGGAQQNAGASSGGGAPQQRKWRQPTLNFGGPQQPAREDERVGKLQEALAAKEEQYEGALKSLDSAQNEILYAKAQAARVSEECMGASKRVERYQRVLADVMEERALAERREARRAQHDQHFELGQLVQVPSATGMRDMWVQGNLPRDINRRMAEVSERQREVEERKKDKERELRSLTRQRKSNTKDALDAADNDQSNGPVAVNNSSSSLGFGDLDVNVMELEEEIQVLKQELEALAQLLTRHQVQMADYEKRKTAFMKELRRINEEDCSQFAGTRSIGPKGRYILMHMLGKGGFSEVWKAFDLAEAEYVACKIHRVSRDWSRQTKDHYLKHANRELEIMRQLNHPRLTRLHAVFEHDDHTFVSVMEFSAGLDLDAYLKRHRTMRENDARVVMMQLVAALRHLAEQPEPIIHYDLKPANILFHSPLESSLDIKITDFGLSKIIANTGGASDDPSIELTSVGTGTYYYMPPECFANGTTTPVISNKVDIWAIGIIFYQMLYGKRPFADGQSQKRIWADNLIVSTARDPLEFPLSPKVTSEAKDLIRRCLTYNAAERPDVIQLSQDAYFRPSTRKRTRGGATLAASEMLPPQ